MKNPICVCLDRNPFPSEEELVAMIAGIGFTGVEWFEAGAEDKWSNPEAAARLRALTRKYGLTAQYHAPYEGVCDLAREVDAPRAPESARDLLCRSMDKGERLGATMLTLHLGSCPPGQSRADALRNVVEGIRLAIPQLEAREMRFAIENHTAAILPDVLGDRPDEIEWVMQQLPSPCIGTTFDLGHAAINGHLDAFLARPVDRMFNTHLHDNHGEKDEHLPLGTGTIPWDRVLARFSAAGYRGPLTLEFFAAPQDYAASIRHIRFTS